MAPYEEMPIEVCVAGPGFGDLLRFATLADAYAEARRVRSDAETGEPVVFNGRLQHLVLEIRVLRWNPLTGNLLAHGRRWTARNTPADVFTPFPPDWHSDPLPADWYTDNPASEA
ncbi:hypothetical protein ACFZAO_05395 [Streptomyces griseoaurantiacus]|uniref:hypothetical protein n=1 Tax=Streptomyces griseoaurantiacus TaxID=68213 RepID=UPI0036E6BE96